MGWTAGDDPMVQVELSFNTLSAAVAFAEREGLTYRVDGNPSQARRDPPEGSSWPKHAAIKLLQTAKQIRLSHCTGSSTIPLSE